MGVVIGFTLGYIFGTKAGREGYEELREAVRGIADSDDVREVVGAAISAVAGILRAGQGVISDGPADTARLRRIA